MNSQFPQYNNFYSLFRGTSKQKIAERLQKNGWTVTESSWGEWSFFNDWSELILTGDESEMLLNGTVIFIHDNVELLNVIFDSLKCEYQYEFYDKQQNILLEKRRPA